MNHQHLYILLLRLHRAIFIPVFICMLTMELIPCDVPVFRYALERWRADPYRLIIYQSGEIDHALSKAVDDLLLSSMAGDSTVNLSVINADPSAADNENLKQLVKQSDRPLMVLLYPEATGIPYPAWTGDLTEANIRILKDSPARQIISTRLLSGETAVFLFLESGDEEKDTQALEILQESLDRLAETIKIPDSGMDISGKPIVKPEFSNQPVSFSSLSLSRDNPAEKIFVSQLLGTESDLAEYRTPLVFPVFGQGRSLYALVGNGIKYHTLEKACLALVAWCSCEIKAMHHGVDLLFSTDWSKRRGETWIKDDLPPLTGLSAFLPVQAVKRISDSLAGEEADQSRFQEDSNSRLAAEISDLDRTGQSSDPPEPEASADLSGNIIILIVIISVFLTIVTFLVKYRSGKSRL